ncbi:response regulator transcription factor [Ideonella sp. 4Y11]|uniref:Response regulator transcription factor n=1 Tax=Ideonella aquatica TaxID=2824119 RepID=A0A941BKH0_9BURK|nr:response regulator transcription factor [Ideonella aquatica]MBQ0959893.1 response regulator transcription factor [Ideonella aquatica]
MPTDAPDRPIRVALVEDDPAIRHRLSQAILATASFELAGQFGTGAEAVAWMRLHRADVMLVDLGLPDCDGVDVITACHQLQPDCQLMVVTMFADERHMLQAFEAGASGYLLKDGSDRELVEHVQHLHAGGSPISPLIARQMLRRWQGDAERGRPAAPALAHEIEPLTSKETEVLDLVAKGLTYVEVAAQLGVAVSTVRTHVRGVYGKLGAHNKTEAVFEARQLGLIR